MCSSGQNIGLWPPCFDHLAKKSPVVNVSSKTIKNLSRYFGVCVVLVET